MRRKDRPLRVRLSQDVLTIEIGINTNAFAALHSGFAYSLMGPKQLRPDTRFRIDDKYTFACDVIRELTSEAEDGSSLLSELFDTACQRAIEEGSIAFIDTKETT